MKTTTPKHTAGNHELNCDCNYCSHLKHCALVHEELLDMLKNVVILMGNMGVSDETLNDVRRLISKAKGGA